MPTRVDRFTLERVHFAPPDPDLAAGVLYVSEEFGTAIHLCACGCGIKVVTPLSNDWWTFSVGANGPTLSPSIGSFQIPCRSHYFLTDGEVQWVDGGSNG